MTDAIVISGVRKTFGPKVAVANLDLRVPTGSVCAFLGPNGAGKTTTIRMVMSIIFPDAGRVSVLGRASAIESKDRIGYLPEERGVYRKMKVGAFLSYMARLKGVHEGEVHKRVDAWLDRVGLADCARKKCEELSKGMQQKIQFVGSIIHEPELVILDEPFSGLDPLNARLLRELIDEQKRKGRTIIFSTHVMSHAEALCDHVFMINRGEKVLDESMAGIQARYEPNTIITEPLDSTCDSSAFRNLPGLRSVDPVGRTFELRFVEGADMRTAFGLVYAAAPTRRVELKRASLEDIFIRLVGDNGGAGRDGLDEEGAGSSPVSAGVGGRS